MEEIWKEIKGYNGDYHVSTYGRVKSYVQYEEGKIMKPGSDKDGYQKVGLRKNKTSKTLRINRLVAVTFIENPNPEEFDQVNHIDEDKTNDHVCNLEWCNCQYNIEYSNSKYYKILFPDGHIETIFNLNKFCDENNLSVSNLSYTVNTGNFCKKHQVLEVMDQEGNIIKTKVEKKELKRKSFKILFPDGHDEIIFNLHKFCRENNLVQSNMVNSFTTGWLHRKFKILERIDEDGNILKAKELKPPSCKIIFPDGHDEIVYNVKEFCKKYNLTKGCMDKTFRIGHFHRNFKILERTDQNGNTVKAKEKIRKSFKILFPDGHIETIFNISQFCRDHDLSRDSLNQKMKTGSLHKGFKILEKINKDGIITKAKK